MPVQLLRKEQLVGSERHLRTETYETVRFLLAADQAEVTVTDVTLLPDVEAEYGSDQHQEIAYYIVGRAELIDSATGQTHPIEPGALAGPPGRALSLLRPHPDPSDLRLYAALRGA